MARNASNLIALALTRTALHLAELRGDGAGAAVVKRSELAWAGDANALPDAALGEALRAHLDEAGYSGKRVAVGLPGAWVLARRWDVPPVDDAARAGIVRMRVEKEFSSGPARLAFDFVDVPSDGGGSGVLLVGVREDRLAAVREMLAAAGLEPASVGVTALAVAAQAGDDATRCVVLEGATTTLVTGIEGRAAGLVSTSTAVDPTRWTGDVSRLLATTPAPGTAPANTSRPLRLLDLSAAGEGLVEAAATRWPDVVIGQADAAEAVGRAALSGERGRIDWQGGRMTPPRTRRVGRAATWTIRVAAVVLLAGLVTGYFWREATQERDALQQELAAIADDSKRLGGLHERTRAAAGWFDERPPVLDCLLELTRTFPRRGEVWVTQFSIDEGRQGVVRGKATEKESMLAYLQEMQRSDVLKETELRDWNESGREQRVVAFEITFRYDGPVGDHPPLADESRVVDEAPRPERGAAG